LVPVAEREVGLEAEDGADLARPGLAVELPRPVEVAVVGEGERVHAQRLDPVEQFGDPVGAVEERVLAVRVEVNERHTACGKISALQRIVKSVASPDILRPMRPLRPMRSIATLFALGLIMAVLHRVTAGGPLEARATLALGFLLLAAIVGGELPRRGRLPRVAGYLLIGFAVGPAWLGLIRREEVEALRFVGDCAVALIGLAAGSELTLDALRPSRVALAR